MHNGGGKGGRERRVINRMLLSKNVYKVFYLVRNVRVSLFCNIGVLYS